MAERISLWGGLALVLFTGLFNIGIISLDDYNNGFAVLIPAQKALPLSELTGGIHPVLPKILLRYLGKGVYTLGVNDPVWQLRFALAGMGVFVFLLLFYSAKRLFIPKSLQSEIALYSVAFYFALPVFSTRPMIETLCLPFLTLSGVWAADYARTGLRRWLTASLFALALASLMRFQAGICGAALLFLVLCRRNRRDFLYFTALTGLLFVASGVPDIFYRGQFHGQLLAYIQYNLAFSGEHFGRMPFYTFFLLAIALSLPPSFFSFYKGLAWRRQYQPLTGPLLFVLFFLLAHSLSPHKEDRFFVPVLALYLFCLVPLAAHLWQNGARWRRVWFLGLNAVLLALSCTNIPQNNVIGLARWVGSQPTIAGVDSLDHSLVFYPQAFLLRSIDWSNDGNWQTYSNQDCSRAAVLRSDIATNAEWKQKYKEAGVFRPGWIEQVLVKANPKNARRGPLIAYVPAACVRDLRSAQSP